LGRLIDKLNDAHYLAGNGAVVINGGEAEIYFVWGQPAHALCKVEGGELSGEAALTAMLARLTETPTVGWKDGAPESESLNCSAQDLIARFEGSGRRVA
jgi:hypothetical protein